MSFFYRSEFDPKFSPVMIRYTILGNYFNCHWHNCYEMIYIEHGSATLMANMQQIVLEEGNLAWVPPGIVHDSIARTADCRAVTMQFDKKLLSLGGYLHVRPDYMNRAYYVRSGIYKIPQAADSANGIQSFLQSGQGKPGTPFGQIGFIFRMLEQIANQSGAEWLDPRWVEHPQLDKLCAYIEAYPRKRHTLRDAARFCGLAETYFSKKFHAYVGIPFKTYADFIRMCEAQKMIIVEKKSISDTAIELQYDSLQNFSRAFKRVTGFSPSDCLQFI